MPLRTHIAFTEGGQRLDRYVASVLNTLSRTGIQQLIKEGSVLVNECHSKSSYILRDGDEIQILSSTLPVQASNARPQPSLPLEVVYDDDELIIVNKPAGMVVHPALGHYDDTLVNALVARYPHLQATNNEPLRPGIVHRLDKDTSGLIIVAKNAQAQAILTEQMKQHEIMKCYLALVEGIMPLDQGSIDAPIGRNPRQRQRMMITAVGSREARTHFRVLQRFAHHTFVLLQLETGRTHQIRVHLQAIGYPVAGDPVYGPHNRSKIRDLGLQRQFLHAYQLRFAHPITQAPLEFEAPLPDDLQTILHHL